MGLSSTRPTGFVPNGPPGGKPALRRKGATLRGRAEVYLKLKPTERDAVTVRSHPPGADRMANRRRSVTPRQQLVDPGDLVVGDAAEYVGEPGLRIDAVQLGAFDQGVGDRRRLAAALGADEENGAMTVLGGHPVRSHIEL